MEFKELKEKIGKFVKEELYSLEPWIYSSEWDEKLPKLNELREKLKKWGFGCLRSQLIMEVLA